VLPVFSPLLLPQLKGSSALAIAAALIEVSTTGVHSVSVKFTSDVCTPSTFPLNDFVSLQKMTKS
jgi:hypothetical protein